MNFLPSRSIGKHTQRRIACAEFHDAVAGDLVIVLGIFEVVAHHRRAGERADHAGFAVFLIRHQDAKRGMRFPVFVTDMEGLGADLGGSAVLAAGLIVKTRERELVGRLRCCDDLAIRPGDVRDLGDRSPWASPGQEVYLTLSSGISAMLPAPSMVRMTLSFVLRDCNAM